MYKLVVSDYDGTLKPKNESTFIDNIDSLIKLRNSSNVMISTGRVYSSIKDEILKHDIPYDFLSCANGNTLFDNKDNIISNSFVESYVLNEIKEMNKYILEIETLDAYGKKTDKPCEYLIHLIEDLKIRRKLVDKLLGLPGFDYCTDGGSKFMIHVFKSVNKIKTIEIVKKLLDIHDSDIITLGDGPNDIEMIKYYNGVVIGDNLDCYNELNSNLKYDSFSSFSNDIRRLSKVRKYHAR